MADDDQDLYRRWGHSFEEDHDDVQVYRPSDFAFPRARGRAGIELRPDGTFIEWAVGRGDAPQERPGRWVAEGQHQLRVRTGSSEQVLELRTVAPDLLELTRVRT